MALKSVKASPDLEATFRAAEEVVAKYFAGREHLPERGSIEISGDRYLLVRASSLSVQFFHLVRKLYGDERREDADDFARNLLFDLAHAIGKSDCRSFQERTGVSDPLRRMAAGPVHFAYTGWAFVELDTGTPSLDENYYGVFDHPYSFEAAAWLDAGERTKFPACVMNAGYAAGWCSECFGLPLVATEISCRARGDEVCRFVMAHAERTEAMLERYHRSRGVGASTAAGEAHHMLDLFARKRMEEELRRSRDDLDERVKRRTAELEKANARLERESAQRAEAERRLSQVHKLDAVGRLAGGIAHDFNSILGVILGRCSMVQSRTRVGDPLWEEMEAIRVACRQGASLTRRMLAFSHGHTVVARPVDVAAVVRSLLEGVLSLLGPEIRLDVDLADGEHVVMADPAQMEQVLINLVVNARDAMPSGGALAIRGLTTSFDEVDVVTKTLSAGRYVVLEVADTGVGMDADTQTHIFEPFFTTKAPEEGSGLGLSTVYGIVEQAGGGIALRSTPGKGSTFTIYLPASEEAVGDVEDPLVLAEPRVLLVEGDASRRASLEEGLVAAGCQVVAPADAKMALALVEQGGLELDVLVTSWTESTLARRVASLRPGVRVVLMADEALTSPSPEVSVMVQPFTVEELVAEIEGHLALAAAEAGMRGSG